MTIKTPILILSVVLISGCSTSNGGPTVVFNEPQSEVQIRMRSLNFSEGAYIPEKYSSYGTNKIPDIRWEPGPKGTKSYALILEDPDAPGNRPFVHWLVINIPRTAKGSGEGGTTETNSTGTRAYYGPHPPLGRPHQYVFEVFALDLYTIAASNREEAFKAMEGHVLATGHFRAMYLKK